MDEKELQEVKKLLISQKPLLRAYWKNVADVQNMLASGEVVVAWTFLAVIAPLRKAGIDAGWVWPKEGAIGWSEAITRGEGHEEAQAGAGIRQLHAEPRVRRVHGPHHALRAGLEGGGGAPRAQLVKDLGIDPKNVSRLAFKEIPKDKSRWNEIWNEVKAA